MRNDVFLHFHQILSQDDRVHCMQVLHLTLCKQLLQVFFHEASVAMDQLEYLLPLLLADVRQVFLRHGFYVEVEFNQRVCVEPTDECFTHPFTVSCRIFYIEA